MRTKQSINPNYLAYAKSTGMTVEQRKAADETEYPGGKMAGFIDFISNQKCEFIRIYRPADTYGHTPGVYSPSQRHWIFNSEEFNIWLHKKFLN